MSYEALLLERHDGIATLTLNQPRSRNAFSPAMLRDLSAALEEVDGDAAVRALVLRGAGPGFCAGGDLSIGATLEGEARTQAAVATLRDRVNPVIRQFTQLRCPTLSVVHGGAAGAGASLALAADLVVAADSAYFLFPFMPRLGILPDMGGTWLALHGAGRARAMGLSLLGDRIPAPTALQWGLIWQCVEEPSLDATAGKLAARLAALPRHAAKELRAAFDQAQHNSFGAQLDYELERQAPLLGGPAFDEGLQAFLGKRDPRFD